MSLDPSLNRTTVLREYIHELLVFLLPTNSVDLFRYLLKEWYSTANFKRWGRKHPHLIPLSRTTMMVEGHWSKLKNSLLQKYNRPRISMLLFIIEKSLLPKMKIEFEMLISGSKKPHWWYRFTNEWKRCQDERANNVYMTDIEKWTCNCKAYMRSPFLTCKHLLLFNHLHKYIFPRFNKMTFYFISLIR